MGFQLGLGFVVAIVTFSALPDSNSFSITLTVMIGMSEGLSQCYFFTCRLQSLLYICV